MVDSLRSPRARAAAASAAAFLACTLVAPRSARADSLRRFTEAHEPRGSRSSTASRSPESSSGSHHHGHGDAVLLAEAIRVVADGVYALGEVAVDATRDDPPSEPSEAPRTFPAAVIYGDGGEGAYVQPWRIDLEENAVHDGGAARRGEVTLGGFLGTNEQVYAHDLALRGWLGLFVAQGSWERFYEPRPSLDTLDMFRVHLGPNILGSKAKSIELYTLLGASALHGSDGAVLPAFDMALEARAYPLRPFAFFASTTLSVFGEGPPLLDARLEGGVSIGRVDVRGGLRALKQEPAQSFFGPVVSVALRM